LSVQRVLRGSNDLRVGRKVATFELFFQSGRAKDLSAPLFLLVYKSFAKSGVWGSLRFRTWVGGSQSGSQEIRHPPKRHSFMIALTKAHNSTWWWISCIHSTSLSPVYLTSVWILILYSYVSPLGWCPPLFRINLRGHFSSLLYMLHSLPV